VPHLLQLLAGRHGHGGGGHCVLRGLFVDEGARAFQVEISRLLIQLDRSTGTVLEPGALAASWLVLVINPAGTPHPGW
jgi:hypothetical protein